MKTALFTGLSGNHANPVRFTLLRTLDERGKRRRNEGMQADQRQVDDLSLSLAIAFPSRIT